MIPRDHDHGDGRRALEAEIQSRRTKPGSMARARKVNSSSASAGSGRCRTAGPARRPAGRPIIRKWTKAFENPPVGEIGPRALVVPDVPTEIDILARPAQLLRTMQEKMHVAAAVSARLNCGHDVRVVRQVEVLGKLLQRVKLSRSVVRQVVMQRPMQRRSAILRLIEIRVERGRRAAFGSAFPRVRR